MQETDPQILYMVLILPGMFGLTLMGEGVYKLTQNRSVGWFNILMGMGFVGTVVGGFLILTGAL
jgi:hypothetical protein